MSTEQLHAFLKALRADAALLDRVKVAEDFESVQAIAKQEGFDISRDDFNGSRTQLAEWELEGLAGGCVYVNTVVASWDTL